jgi:SAM-dependent methyltransferase
VKAAAGAAIHDWPLACPACRAALGPLSAHQEAGEVRCPGCGMAAPRVEGIWRFLPPAAAARYAPFLADYTRIRLAERRGSDDPAHYLGLPSCPPDHPIAWQWALRRRTFAAFVRRVLPRLAVAGAAGAAAAAAGVPGADPTGLRIVELGAGVGWLCHRLALLGHQPLAVDLSVDERDGLGAARHYRPAWPRFQAEFDRLPLAAGVADLVIFNASLHYSTDYEATLGEALRVLADGGTLAILESPIYRRQESGQRMVDERRADFARRFGTRSDALPSRDYLTWPELADLERRLGLRFRKVTPWYGWRWAMRPWLARLRRRREPSRFTILLARKPGG